MYYKPTDFHSYLLLPSSLPTHVKNSIPFSHFLRLRRLCSDEFEFSSKSEEILQFFKNRGYPDSVGTTAQQCAQLTNSQPHNVAKGREPENTIHTHFSPTQPIVPVNNIILKNFMTTKQVESSHYLHSSHLNVTKTSDLLVRSTLKSDESPGTFNCTRKRCKTCPFIHNTDKVTGPKPWIKINDRFAFISPNVVYA